MCLRKRNGFLGITMVEMLISITLLGMILALMGGTFFQSDKFEKKINAKIEYRRKVRNLKNILKRDFSNAVYLSNFAARSKPNQPILNTGIVGKFLPELRPRTDQVFMHSNAPSIYHTEIDVYKDPGVHEIGYFAGKTNRSGVFKLYRREDFYIDDKFDFQDNPYQNETFSDTNKSITHPLLSDLLYFEIKYLDSGANSEESWVDDWDSEKKIGRRIPYAVRVTVKFPLIDIEDLDDFPEFDLENPEYVITETFQIIIRWKLEDSVEWGF